MIEFFPYEKPRDVQADCLEALAENWNNYDVFILSLPTGAGKTALAYSISKFLQDNNKKAVVGVPNNILRKQYLDEFDEFRTIRAIEEYKIPPSFSNGYGINHIGDVLKAMRTKGRTKQANDKRKLAYAIKGVMGNPYQEDLLAVKMNSNLSVANYYSIMAHKLYNCADAMIFDEGHQVLSTLQDLHVKKLPRSEYKFPLDAQSQDDLFAWAESTKGSEDPKVQKLREVLEDVGNNWSMSIERNKLSKELHLKPISVKGESPLLWGGKKSKKQKLIFMSATISEEEIKRMNINKEVMFLDFNSPIPAERRPVVIKNVANMSYAEMDESIDEITDYIGKLANFHNEDKGFIHAPYNVAEMLQERFKDDERFVFHDKHTKKEVLDEWLSSTGNKILVGSGMYEGLDLKGDRSRWQVILKVPYPSLADSRNRLILKEDPDYYGWIASKDLLQACGRVCRGENDYGVTYMLDSQFDNWFTRMGNNLPSWFKVAVER